jgi:alkanesulfonate monooxygenase SsuD/methylene tetrahydromethanopterin reductase-like flavin-dependent oxidoreductase (luciferase family)
MDALRFGLNLGDAPPDLSAAAQLDVYLRQVDAGQRAGFRDFFVGHHYSYTEARWLQPIPLLARLTAELDAGCRLGTGILVAPLLSPVALAEEAATLAAMAPGRVVLGVGTGYRRIEYLALGVDWTQRQLILERSIRILRQQWRGEPSMINGVEVASGCRLDRADWPTIVIGAKSPSGARLAGRCGAGLIAASKQPVGRLEWLQAEHRAAWAGPGAPPAAFVMRNVELGPTVSAAAASQRARSRQRMEGYEREGLALGPSSPYGESGDLGEEALLGPAAAVRQDLERLAGRVAIESILVRAQWPGMSGEEVERWLRQVGQALIEQRDASDQSTVSTTPRRTAL